MSTRHLSYILGALLLGAVVLAAMLLVVGPERVEDQTVELFEVQQKLLAEQGADRISETLRDLEVRLATSVTHRGDEIRQAQGPAELEGVLTRLSHPADTEMGITLLVRDGDGDVLAVSPGVLPAQQKMLQSQMKSTPVGDSDTALSLCRSCLEQRGSVSVSVEMDKGRFLVATIPLDKLAGRIFAAISRSRTAFVALLDRSGDVIHSTGSRDDQPEQTDWVVGQAAVHDSGWKVEAAAPRSAIAPEVRQRVSSLLYGTYGVIGALLAGIGTLVVLKRREHRERLQRVRALAHQDKLATLGLLAASTVHEIRNAIAVAKLQLQVASAHANEQQDERLVAAEKSVDRLGELAGSLSNYAGKDKQRLQRFDAAIAVQEALGVVEPKLKGTVELRYEGDSNLEVFGSRSALVQVLVNLVLNALEATEEVDTPRIEVHLARKADAAVISVTDNGSGIEAAVLEHIFEPFFTTKDGTGDGDGGTGIGLWLCSQIVEQHNGTISAENLASGGAMFSVRIPIDADAEAGARLGEMSGREAAESEPEPEPTKESA